MPGHCHFAATSEGNLCKEGITLPGSLLNSSTTNQMCLFPSKGFPLSRNKDKLVVRPHSYFRLARNTITKKTITQQHGFGASLSHHEYKDGHH